MTTLPDTLTEKPSRLGAFSFEVKPHQLLNEGLAAVGATGGALMLVDYTGEWLEVWARLGPPHKRGTDPRFAIGDSSIAGFVAANGEPYLCSDVTRDPHFAPPRAGLPNFRSLLAVPIFWGDRVIGVISADHGDQDAFCQTDVDTLQHFAGQMAASLVRELERSRLDQTLISLHEVGALLTRLSGEGSLTEVLQRVATQARQVLEADLVTLYQYEARSGEFLVEGSGPTTDGDLYYRAPMKTRIYPDDVAWKIIAQGQSRFFTDAEHDEFLAGFVPARDGQEGRPRFAVREKIKSVAALVLHVGDEIVGVMFVNYRKPHKFTDNERRILETFANYAAIAIQNARLVQTIEKAQEQRVAAEKLTVLNSIAPAFAHKMANAVGTIPVAVQEIRRKLGVPSHYIQRQLNRIETDAKGLLQMAEQLQQGLEAGSPEVIDDMPALLTSVKACIGKDHPFLRLDLEIPASLPPIRGIRSQLHEVFLNLARNAAEAMLPEPGRLTIRAQPSEDGKFIEIEFSDTGRGILPENQRRIFDLGFTTKSERGMGFGLWWCHTALRSQGGDIRLKSSRPAAGSTFIVQLPVAQER